MGGPDLTARLIVAFANRELSPALWKTLQSWRNTPFELQQIMWPTPDRRSIPATSAGLKQVRRLQRDVRVVLDGIIQQNPKPLMRFLNHDGPFSYSVWRRPESTPRFIEPVWEVSLFPVSRRHGPHRRTAINLVDTLSFANRLGRCGVCKLFLLSQRAYDQPPKFCSTRCSTQFHNARRLASGYFTERRRIQRARVARRAQ